MGRPSLGVQRREEILDAVIACILRFGLEGATRARIAEEAGVTPSAIHHFVGTQDEVIRAALARALRQVTDATIDTLVNVPADNRLERHLEALFGPHVAAPEVNQLIDELIAHSYRDERIRDELGSLYRKFAELLDHAVDSQYPDSPRAMRRAVSYSLLALAHSSPTLAWLDFDPEHLVKIRTAADLLLGGLAVADDRENGTA
jgi:AcrR family transcriptional regulator